MPKKQTYQFGILAEKIVIIFLWLKFYRIVAWRYKTRFGEIDVIAKRGKIISIIEVKARKSAIIFEEVLQQNQIRRIKRATEFFLIQNPQLCNHQIRFDFIAVNKFFWPKHYRNFWE